MGDFSRNDIVTVHGDEVTCTDFDGLGPQGERPQRLAEECQAAQNAISGALAEHGLTLDQTRHVAAMLREGDGFSQCQSALGEALASARPALTLRIVQGFPDTNQRIALSLIASPSP